MTPGSRASSVLAVLAGVLVLVRVVGSTAGTLASGPLLDVVTAATVVLLLAGLAFVAAAAWFGLGSPRSAARPFFRRVLTGFVVVMAAYLALGVGLGLHVPWTAYAVLVGVGALGAAALVVDGRSASEPR